MGPRGNQNRAVLVAHARAVGQQRVAIDQVCVGVERDGRDFVPALKGGTVQRLDIGQHLVDLDAVDANGAARQAVEHERIVRVRAVRDGDLHRGRIVLRSEILPAGVTTQCG